MKGYAIRKIPDGKFIRIETVHDDVLIGDVKITGDFFLFPEDTIVEIEKELRGLKRPIDKSHATERMERVLKEKKATLVGVSTHDIIDALKEATQ